MTKAKTKTKKPPGVSLPPKKLSPTAQVAADLQALKESQDELVEKYSKVHNPKPHLECRIFPLPDYCSVSDVAMRELDGEDDILSSYWADHHAGAMEQGSAQAAAIADQREGIRLSLVGVEGAQVNEDGVPFMDCNAWTSKTWRFLMQYFAELNGVPNEDLKNGVRRATLITRTSKNETGSNQEEAPSEE